MFYPLQIPSILDADYIKSICYQEFHPAVLEQYIMCIWSMKSFQKITSPVQNIILPDGCIDLIVDFYKKEIFFSGTSKASLNFPLIGEINYLGVRMKPGIFYELFKIPCSKVMDQSIAFDQIEKNISIDFIFDEDKDDKKLEVLQNYFIEKTANIKLDSFINMIRKINGKTNIKFVTELAQSFGYSERHLNRIFKERCGVSPKVFLNIIRLHESLKLLINHESDKLIHLALESGFYDEAHFIKEIKRYCGLSPTDLIKRYKMS